MVEVFGGYVAEVCLTIMVQMQWTEGKYVFWGVFQAKYGKMGKLELQENTGWLIYTYTTTLQHRGQPRRLSNLTTRTHQGNTKQMKGHKVSMSNKAGIFHFKNRFWGES